MSYLVDQAFQKGLLEHNQKIQGADYSQRRAIAHLKNELDNSEQYRQLSESISNNYARLENGLNGQSLIVKNNLDLLLQCTKDHTNKLEDQNVTLPHSMEKIAEDITIALNNRGEQISRSMQIQGQILGIVGTMNNGLQSTSENVVKSHESLRKLLVDGNISLYKKRDVLSDQK